MLDGVYYFTGTGHFHACPSSSGKSANVDPLLRTWFDQSHRRGLRRHQEPSSSFYRSGGPQSVVVLGWLWIRFVVFSWSEKRHSIDNLNFCLQPTLSWESGRNWKTRKAIRFCVSVAWLAARRTTWLLSARSTGIKCKCFLGEFRYCCKSLTMNLIDRMGAAMHLRSQEWNMDWLYEFLPRYGDVPTNA